MNSVMIALLIFIFYFFMVRPQQKKQKEIKKFREALGAGDKVITAGGIHGEIVSVKDTYFIVEIAPSVKIPLSRSQSPKLARSPSRNPSPSRNRRRCRNRSLSSGPNRPSNRA